MSSTCKWKQICNWKKSTAKASFCNTVTLDLIWPTKVKIYVHVSKYHNLHIAGQPGSGAFNSALYLRGVASMSIQRRDACCVFGVTTSTAMDDVLTVELQRRLQLTGIHGHLAQRSFRWFGYAAIHPDGELIRNPVFFTPPRTWTTTTKSDLELLSGPWVFGYARWRMDRVKASSKLMQGHRARIPSSDTWKF